MKSLKQVQIYTARLLIRTFQSGDAPCLYQFVRDNETQLYDTGPYTLRSNPTIDASRQFLARLEQDRLMGKWLWNAILDKQTEAYLGHISIMYIDNAVKRCELGYFISMEESGKGYATEALEAIVDYCFRSLGMNKIRLRIKRGNEASIRVAKKVGFVECGFFKQDFRTFHGTLVDMFYFELIREK